MIGIFFPVDGCHMGWIFIKVRSPDSKLRVRIDPVDGPFSARRKFNSFFRHRISNPEFDRAGTFKELRHSGLVEACETSRERLLPH